MSKTWQKSRGENLQSDILSLVRWRGFQEEPMHSGLLNAQKSSPNWFVRIFCKSNNFYSCLLSSLQVLIHYQVTLYMKPSPNTDNKDISKE